MDDCINRQAAVDALWKALYDYEDKSEKAFQESEELDVRDWFLHRGFVQNMSDIDRQTILSLPSANAVEVVRCKDCLFGHRYFDVQDGEIDRWVECRNPDGLHRDVSEDEYCSASIRRHDEQQNCES